MKKINAITVALVSLMATGAFAAQTVAKKKVIQKKPISRQAVTTKRQAKEDRLTTPQSSAISAASATASMPGLTAGTSTAGAPAAMKKKTAVDNLRFGVGLEYYGGSITDPLSGWQPDKSEGYSQGNSSHELDTRVTAGYALSDNLTVSYNAYFFSHSDAPGESDGETFRFRAADSYLKLGVGQFVQSGKFKWNGDFRLYPALGSDYKGRVAYFRTGQNFTYALSPRLTAAAYSTLRYYHNNDSAYAPENDSKGQKVDARMTLSPTIEYQIADPMGLALSFNMDFAHTHRNNTFDETENYKGPDYGAYVELGASIDISKKVNLNPYVDMFTKAFNPDGMQLGANLNLTVL